MTRIKSVWLKSGPLRAAPGFSAAPTVCENGEWVTAIFRYCEYNMRWERTSPHVPRLMTLSGPLNLTPGGFTLAAVAA